MRKEWKSVINRTWREVRGREGMQRVGEGEGGKGRDALERDKGRRGRSKQYERRKEWNGVISR